jgi:hypothetical protein
LLKCRIDIEVPGDPQIGRWLMNTLPATGLKLANCVAQAALLQAWFLHPSLALLESMRMKDYCQGHLRYKARRDRCSSAEFRSSPLSDQESEKSQPLRAHRSHGCLGS